MNLRHPFKLWSAPQQVPSGNSISQNNQDDNDRSRQPDMLVDNLAQVIQLQPGSLFTHSIIAGIVVETSILALADLAGIVCDKLPPVERSEFA